MKNYLCSLIFILTIFIQCDIASADVYVTTDKHGTLIYSDSPSQDSLKINIKTNHIITPAIDSKPLESSKIKKTPISNIHILTPQNETTIRNNNGLVKVTTHITPKLLDGYKIQLYLDGQLYSQPSPQKVFTLSNVYRGEHIIQTELINDKGKVIALSEKITFYMHRNRQ